MEAVKKINEYVGGLEEQVEKPFSAVAVYDLNPRLTMRALLIPLKDLDGVYHLQVG